jgi:hypothetical protein
MTPHEIRMMRGKAVNAWMSAVLDAIAGDAVPQTQKEPPPHLRDDGSGMTKG